MLISFQARLQRRSVAVSILCPSIHRRKETRQFICAIRSKAFELAKHPGGAAVADCPIMENQSTYGVNRRGFIGSALAGAGMAAAAESELPRPHETRKGDMLYR